MVNRFDIYLVNLDDEPSKDAKNTRPAVVISPDEMNRHLDSVMIAPISAPGQRYPTRLPVELLNSERAIVLDQLRTIDKDRLVKHIGEVDKATQHELIERLQEMFAG